MKTTYKISKNYIIINGKEKPYLINEFIVLKRHENMVYGINWEIVASFKTYEEAENYIKRGL